VAVTRERGFSFGSGLVSGASDNDPTTVATLAVIGSTTGYALGWLVLLVIPMLVIVQTIAAHVGAVSRKGLEDCVRANYGRGWAFAAMLSILAVNVVTLGADLSGGAAALQVVTGADYRIFIVPFALLASGLLVFARYEQLMTVLRFLPLLFVLYVGAAFMAHPVWGDVLRATLVPHVVWNQNAIAGTIALLGTTLTSYAYVWETIEVSEERPPLRQLGLVQADAAFGVIVAGMVFWFITIATGATLGAHHSSGRNGAGCGSRARADRGSLCRAGLRGGAFRLGLDRGSRARRYVGVRDGRDVWLAKEPRCTVRSSQAVLHQFAAVHRYWDGYRTATDRADQAVIRRQHRRRNRYAGNAVPPDAGR